MPSPNYPSEIECCGDNGSINEVICNKNLLNIYNQRSIGEVIELNGVTATIAKEPNATIADDTAIYNFLYLFQKNFKEITNNITNIVKRPK